MLINKICRFALGPLELRVVKMMNGKLKSAKAVTEMMQGLMDLKIDNNYSRAEIADVFFDEPGGVDVSGNLKKRAHIKYNENPYRYYYLSTAYPSEARAELRG